MKLKGKDTPPGSKYLPLMDDQQPFKITAIHGMPYTVPQRKNIPSRQEVFHMVWIKNGGGNILLDSGHIPLLSNTLYCVLPKQMMMLSPTAKTQGHIISFSADFLKLTPNKVNPLYCSTFFSSPAITLLEKTQEELHGVIDGMNAEYKNNSPLKMDILREYLKIALMYLSRQDSCQVEANVQTARATLINNFFEQLQTNFATKKKVSEYANLLSISANYLNCVIKQASGQSASHHIYQRLITEAKRRAIYTDKSMKQIAFELGFEEHTHFSKFFKKMEGITFSAYRKTMNEEIFG